MEEDKKVQDVILRIESLSKKELELFATSVVLCLFEHGEGQGQAESSTCVVEGVSDIIRHHKLI